MLENLRFYVIFLTLLSLGVGLLYWYKLPTNRSKLFLYTIFFSAVMDFLGTNFTQWTGLLNYWIYNFYFFILFIVYIILLRSLLKKLAYKYISRFFLIFFIVFSLTNWIFFQNGINTILTYNYAIGVIFITILGSLYLFEIFSTDLILSYSRSIYFWFVIGVMIFHIPFLPFMLSLKLLLIKYSPTAWSLIIFFLNLLMNASFIIGFICSEKRYNY